MTWRPFLVSNGPKGEGVGLGVPPGVGVAACHSAVRTPIVVAGADGPVVAGPVVAGPVVAGPVVAGPVVAGPVDPGMGGLPPPPAEGSAWLPILVRDTSTFTLAFSPGARVRPKRLV